MPTATRERPVPFLDHDVRSAHDGSKTQFRRIVKPRHDWFVDQSGEFRWPYYESYVTGDSEAVPVLCPYGEVGDTLWVREAWNVSGMSFGFKPKDAALFASKDAWKYRATDTGWQHGWRPSIHMPREAARIFLRVTDIRVQRLQEISEEDAIAEGCQGSYTPSYISFGEVVGPYGEMPCDQFRQLWSDVYGSNSWDANPWVWAITFERIKT